MSRTIKKFKRGWLGGKTKLRISSPVGYRIHPVRGGRRFHYGNDIAVPVGTAIYAPCDGSIKKNFQRSGAGLYLVLSSGGYNFYFMHLSRVVKSSGSVREGELIAYTGGAKNDPNAGGSTGPHLHFECRTGTSSSTYIDTKYWITDQWVTKTGRTLVSEVRNQPLISKNRADYTPEEQEERISEINQETINADNEYDASAETDWSESETEEIVEIDKTLDEGLAAGIWQIIKLAIDGNVANLRVRDAATSLQQGALINFFQKMCQEPFVEFFGDTYGDQFYLIARKPPFDKEGMFKTMETQGLFKTTNNYSVELNDNSDVPIWQRFVLKNEQSVNSGSKIIYDIDEADIITSNISFNNQGIYSWYQFIPIYELGSPAELQYIIPAVLFPEYAAIWGSRSMIVRSQYRNFLNSVISDEVKNGNKSEQGDAEVRHSIHDLKYIIESNAYAPFVRQGTIQIVGNRKFKRGTFVRIKWDYLDCYEIFYIESVSQNYSVNSGTVQRTTTLTLSRGMLDAYMFTKENKITKTNDSGENADLDISYFNLINFGDYENNRDKLDMDKWRDIISSWKVNTDVFKFFLRKMQFISQNSAPGVEVEKNAKNVF